MASYLAVANIASTAGTQGQAAPTPGGTSDTDLLLRIIQVNTRSKRKWFLRAQERAIVRGSFQTILYTPKTKGDGGLVRFISLGDLRKEYQTALSGIGPGGTT